MPETGLMVTKTLDRQKFRDPEVTAKGEPRAVVALTRFRTLWINTGSLCNLTCAGCYIESSPTNDRLAYISAAEVGVYLDEIRRERMPVEEIGFTGGEPFMNRELPTMIEDSLARGFRVLVLTNAMKPMHHRRAELLALKARFRDALAFRVSLDHYEADLHERLRGPRTWQPALDGLRWLAANGFSLDVAGRTVWDEPEDALRDGYRRLFAREGLPIDADDPASLILFPEMDTVTDAPEISVHCWQTLGVAPDSMMCASSRMVIKRKSSDTPVVVPCTLLPYDPEFELGETLAEGRRSVRLNHPFCAQFCVLGGASCSSR